jgi:Tfp pilus assembly protein PilX
MQEKMAGASRDSGLAFQAAESALRDAENCITGTTADCAFDAANPAHFAQDDATFPAGLQHNKLFDASYWAGIDPPGDPTTLAGVPSKGQGDPEDGVNYIIRKASTVGGGAGGAKAIVVGGYGNTAATESQVIYEITARGAGASSAGQSVLRVYFRR